MGSYGLRHKRASVACGPWEEICLVGSYGLRHRRASVACGPWEEICLVGSYGLRQACLSRVRTMGGELQRGTVRAEAQACPSRVQPLKRPHQSATARAVAPQGLSRVRPMGGGGAASAGAEQPDGGQPPTELSDASAELPAKRRRRKALVARNSTRDMLPAERNEKYHAARMQRLADAVPDEHVLRTLGAGDLERAARQVPDPAERRAARRRSRSRRCHPTGCQHRSGERAVRAAWT